MTDAFVTNEDSINALRVRFHFFRNYRFNHYGAPSINGNSPTDLGMVLLFLQELNDEANCVNLSEILLSPLITCKNWVKKLREECACEIVWHSQTRVGKYFVVKSTGIFSGPFYDEFRGYVKHVIDNWRTHKHDHI